jgi:hypothetical protein
MNNETHFVVFDTEQHGFITEFTKSRILLVKNPKYAILLPTQDEAEKLIAAHQLTARYEVRTVLNEKP